MKMVIYLFPRVHLSEFLLIFIDEGLFWVQLYLCMLLPHQLMDTLEEVYMQEWEVWHFIQYAIFTCYLFKISLTRWNDIETLKNAAVLLFLRTIFEFSKCIFMFLFYYRESMDQADDGRSLHAACSCLWHCIFHQFHCHLLSCF